MFAPDPLILLTHEFAPFRGGAATYVQEIAGAAARCGIPVEVWAPDRGQPAGDAAWGFPVIRLRCSGKLGLRAGGLAWALARRRGQWSGRRVVLLSVGTQMAWAALEAWGVVPAANVTVFFHGSEVARFGRSIFWSRLMTGFYRRVSRYAVASRFVEKLVRESPLTDRRVPIIQAPCATPKGLQPSIDKAPGDRPGLRLLTVARLHPRKGQLEMAAAVGLLPGELRSRIVYSMVGSGREPYRQAVEVACRSAGVSYEFTGNVSEPELAAAYEACDIYGQSSRTLPHSVEGFGISYLEAAAFGKPCVGVDTGGVGEAVLDGVTGLLAPEGDLAALAGCIARLAADAGLRRQMGEAGRRHAATFNWEDSARALLADL